MYERKWNDLKAYLKNGRKSICIARELLLRMDEMEATFLIIDRETPFVPDRPAYEERWNKLCRLVRHRSASSRRDAFRREAYGALARMMEKQ